MLVFIVIFLILAAFAYLVNKHIAAPTKWVVLVVLGFGALMTFLQAVGFVKLI